MWTAVAFAAEALGNTIPNTDEKNLCAELCGK